MGNAVREPLPPGLWSLTHESMDFDVLRSLTAFWTNPNPNNNTVAISNFRRLSRALPFVDLLEDDTRPSASHDGLIQIKNCFGQDSSSRQFDGIKRLVMLGFADSQQLVCL
jgi:hypothetical protein